MRVTVAQCIRDQFIITGTDGLWDVFSGQEAVDFIHEVLRNSASSTAETLASISQ
jgi:serine/threonine protein phosphatase PrpC